MGKKMYSPQCKSCGDDYDVNRWKLGIVLCMSCGDDLAKERKFTVAPINKSNYMMITDMTMLKQLNPKRTT
jgi:ribosomal protein L37AE/L43A